MIGFACNSRIPCAKCLEGRPITFCNSTKSCLSPFSKLPKGNGAPHANSVKLRRNCMRYSMNLRQFAKRAQITFGAIAKGNLLPLSICLKSKQTFFNSFTKVISGSLCSFWTTDTELTFKTFKTMDVTLYMYKIEHCMQICLRNLRIACNSAHVLQYR